MRFSDLQKTLGISKPVLSEHLKNLRENDNLSSFWDGRERYYVLHEKFYRLKERRIDNFSSNFLSDFTNKIMFHPPYTIWDLFDELGTKLKIFLIFCMLKSIETGQNWIDAVDLRSLSLPVLNKLAQELDSNNENEIELDEVLFPMNVDNFKPLHSVLNKKIHKDNIKEIYDMLEDNYPEEMEMIDKAYRIQKPKKLAAQKRKIQSR